MLILEKIVVTGHTGFIGTNLVSTFGSAKYKITGISRILWKNSGIKQIKKDLRQIVPNDIDKNSIIIHLAAMTDFTLCEKNPTECFSVNVLGTQNILEIARKKNCKVVYLSTSHVYGRPTKIPINEQHARNASSIYSASKIGGEVCCESYATSYGIDISIIRPFSIYGPGSASHLVTSKIITQLLSKNTIKLGNLFPRRDFVYITDVTRAIEIVVNNLCGFNIYNVGTGKSHSIREICKILMKLSKKNIPVIQLRSISRKQEIVKIVSDSTRIKNIGWESTVNIQQGLKMTLDWYENNLKKF